MRLSVASAMHAAVGWPARCPLPSPPSPPARRSQITILVPNNGAWFDFMFKNGAPRAVRAAQPRLEPPRVLRALPASRHAAPPPALAGPPPSPAPPCACLVLLTLLPVQASCLAKSASWAPC